MSRHAASVLWNQNQNQNQDPDCGGGQQDGQLVQEAGVVLQPGEAHATQYVSFNLDL